ncbi:MAG: pyridoxal-phosphate dependent enzyme [Alphaproteobacteria bacterium]|nr:pyridoxal-phosphate dependent enzyme [Alphaproteobacteria bacterium]
MRDVPARRRGTNATIVMPKDAPDVKVEITRALGAEVVLYDRNSEDREAISADISDRTGAVIVPPYDHTAVIAGQGAVGLEAMQQMEEIGAVPETSVTVPDPPPPPPEMVVHVVS